MNDLLVRAPSPLIRQLIADLDALVEAELQPIGWRSRLKLGLGLDSWLLLCSFRTRQWLKAHHIPAVGRIIRAVEMAAFGAEISLNATVGTGVYIVHTHGVVIGGTTVLGDRVKLLGSNTFGNSKGIGDDYPAIGHDVLIGAGARLLGAIHVGDRAKIGANAVVLDDVAADKVAVGIPARAK